MNKKWREYAKKVYNHYGQEFEATLILEDDNFFIMDWRDKNGSGNLATRYIVDKKKGDLIIKGDAGDCIACWFNEVTPEKLAVYINSTSYFIEKFQCSSNKYTYDLDDIQSDLEELREEYLGYLRNDDLMMFDDEDMDADEKEEELNQDFDDMSALLEDNPPHEGWTVSDDLVELFSKYNADWWESGFVDLGKRIDKRVYLWTYGFQEGVEQLRGKQFVNKDV